jgi:mRNA interferase MazF
MARILRGDIIWANLDPTPGREQSVSRPILVLSENIFNDRSGTVIAVVLTSQQPGASFPLTFELSDPSLPKKSWVKISRIRMLSIQRLGRKIGTASDEELETIIEGLNEIIGGA